jgi:hypothetical protein
VNTRTGNVSEVAKQRVILLRAYVVTVIVLAVLALLVWLAVGLGPLID